MDGRIHSFEPIAQSDAQLLILGTMPSQASLAQRFYYAHPRNCFWPMMAQLLGENLPIDIPGRRAMLIRHRIALWDVAHSCERLGSLDSAIRLAEPNDIQGLLMRCPDVRRILFNGGAAMRLFHQLLPGVADGIEQRQMPSTSPAYTIAYEKKSIMWADGLLQ